MTSSLMFSQASPEYLLSQANQKISVLEESLEHIAQTKIQLRDHAQEVKSQIHNAISRQLETLRNREVWLLGQVDVLKQAKDDLLFQQQEEISQALGALKNALDCLESTLNSEDSNVEQVLAETLEKLKSLNLHPCEMPHITFKANNPAMKSAIFKFGKVDSKGLPTEVAFADPMRPSSSLPRCFEEYGDAEHHVLYKTLESVKREKNNDHSIQVKIPKLSGSDWLYKPSASYPSSVQPESSDSGRATTSIPLATWLHRSGSETSNLPKFNDASIQQWLHHIQEGEMEEDFEFLESHKTRTSSESESIEIVPMPVEIHDNDATFGYFDEVKLAPNTAWLLQSQDSVHVNENDDSSARSLASQLTYFREVSDDVDDWLSKTRSVTEVKFTGDKKLLGRNVDFCYTQCVCRPDQMEIEDLEAIACVSTPGSKASSASDLRTWLKRDRSPEDDTESPSLAKVCRANELCSSVGECCCTPNCIERNQEENPWIRKEKNISCCNGSLSESTEIILKTWREILNTPMSDWLRGSPKDGASKEDMEKMEIDPILKSMMSMSLSTSQWLRNYNDGLEGSSSTTYNVEKFAVDEWLAKQQTSCFSDFGELEKGDYSSWLSEKLSETKLCDNRNENAFAVLLSGLENKVWLKKENEKSSGEAFSFKDAVIKSDFVGWLVNKDMECN